MPSMALVSAKQEQAHNEHSSFYMYSWLPGPRTPAPDSGRQGQLLILLTSELPHYS